MASLVEGRRRPALRSPQSFPQAPTPPATTRVFPVHPLVPPLWPTPVWDIIRYPCQRQCTLIWETTYLLQRCWPALPAVIPIRPRPHRPALSAAQIDELSGRRFLVAAEVSLDSYSANPFMHHVVILYKTTRNKESGLASSSPMDNSSSLACMHNRWYPSLSS